LNSAAETSKNLRVTRRGAAGAVARAGDVTTAVDVPAFTPPRREAVLGAAVALGVRPAVVWAALLVASRPPALVTTMGRTILVVAAASAIASAVAPVVLRGRGADRLVGALELLIQPLAHLPAENDTALLQHPSLRVPAELLLVLEDVDDEPKYFSRLDVRVHEQARQHPGLRPLMLPLRLRKPVGQVLHLSPLAADVLRLGEVLLMGVLDGEVADQTQDCVLRIRRTGIHVRVVHLVVVRQCERDTTHDVPGPLVREAGAPEIGLRALLEARSPRVTLVAENFVFALLLLLLLLLAAVGG
jgi:hypothetical protein